MAGSGLKSFTSTVLTSSDVNNYLMQQSVMTFASSAARTTAFTTAGVTVAEGMTSYLLDSNRIDVYDGSAWQPLPIGAWTTYAPTNSGVTVSGSYVTAKYIQIGKVVHFYARFNLTSTVTGSSWGITLPVTAANSVLQPFMAEAIISSVVYPCFARMTSTTGMTIYGQNASATYVTTSTSSGSIPGSWASGDSLIISGTYEAA